MKERDYYEPLRAALQQHIKARFSLKYPTAQVESAMKAIEMLSKDHGERALLEITADRDLSNSVKDKIVGRDLIYFFLKKARPDLTGFIRDRDPTDFLVIEFKDRTLELEDIYQLKKYADLLDSRYSLLVSSKELPIEVKRLVPSVIPDLLSRATGLRALTLVHFDPPSRSFLEWFPKDPFQE